MENALELERRCRTGRRGDCWKLKSSFVLIGQCAGEGDAIARDLLERACESKCAEACSQRAELVARGWFHEPGLPTRGRVVGDLGHALPFYERACDLGHPQACANAGWLTRDGIGTPADPKRGTAILERACANFQRARSRTYDYGIACNHLADSYADGRGVPANLPKARELQHVFCGDDLGCDELYLVSSDATRVTLWVIELLLVVLANVFGVLAFLPRFREKRLDGRAFLIPIIAIGGVLGGIAMSIELAYFFWGSSVSSPFWLFVAVPICVLPLVVGFQRPKPAS